MEYYSQNEKETSTSNLQNRLYLEEPDIMIPQNTTIITKEMKKQLDVEQAMILKELERYDSWFNNIQFHCIGAIGKLKLLTKK